MNMSRQLHFSLALQLSLIVLGISAALGHSLPWSRSLEPDGHVWPDGHTCAYVIATADNFLAVRSGPGVTYSLAGKLKPNDFVDVSACVTQSCKAGPWRVIEHIDWSSDGDGEHPIRGWVNGRLLRQTACLDEP